jgi:hypothetical protein
MSQRDTVLVPMLRYRCPEGRPTCSPSLSVSCKLLQAYRMGQSFRCAYVGEEVEHEAGRGYIRPHEDCPLWRLQK